MDIGREDIGVFVHATALTATGGFLSLALPDTGGMLFVASVLAAIAWLVVGYAAALVVSGGSSSSGLDLFGDLLPVTEAGTVARPGQPQVALLVYFAAVVATGWFLTESLQFSAAPLVSGLSLVFGLLWAAYFRASMRERLERLREGRLPGWVEEMMPEEEPDPEDLEGGDDETPEDVEYPWQN